MSGLVLASLVVVAVIAALAGWVMVWRRPTATATSQTVWAALVFPVLALTGFVVAIVMAIAEAQHVQEPGQSQYMPVFALTLFLVYALALGLIVGWPSAALSVWWFRRRLPGQPDGSGA